jgi:predicted AlkP superfamily phosphohydrolase/phosphomutase
MKARRCFVIGLDGMPRSLLRFLAAEGTMPFCADLLAQGMLASLRAPLPALSSTSWATFLTGVNPGRHGIFGFVDLKPLSYEACFPNLASLAAPPLWDVCDRAGLRTASLNVPSTYPARRINGVLVSGFVVPDPSRAVFPSALNDDLRALGYVFDVEIGDPSAEPRPFMERIHEALDVRTRAFCDLITRHKPDLTIAVFTETDRLQHFLWRVLQDPAAPLHEATLEVYRHVDACLERIISLVAPADDLVLISDHGFGDLRAQVCLNAWLCERGYLSRSAYEAGGPAGLNESTRAFTLPTGRIYVHTRSRFPRGAVSEADAAVLRAEIRDELWGLVSSAADSGGRPARVCDDIVMSEEAYHGPAAAQAPDLVAVPAAGFDFRASWNHAAVLGEPRLTGAHTRDNGMLYVRGRDRDLDVIDMQDAAPTILGLLGLGGDGSWDGRDVFAGRRP